jgi:hypothetical protein
MSTGHVRFRGSFAAERLDFPLGPLTFDLGFTATKVVGMIYTLATATTVQLIGGASPQFSDITTVRTLGVHKPDYALLIAYQGQDITTQRETVNANGSVWHLGVSLTNVALRNESGSTATFLLVIEGT